MHPLHPLLLLLHLLLLFPPALSSADFCDGEPRLTILTRSCPISTTSSLLLRLPALDHNPFHALHDYLWAVSHYLLHCVTSHHPTLHIPGPPVSPADCRAPAPSRPAYWGVCTALALAAHADAAVLFDPHHTPCFEKEVRFVAPPHPGFGDLPPHFRRLTWFGRGCVTDRHGICLAPRHPAGLVPLPDYLKAIALATLRDAVMSFVGLAPPPDRDRKPLVRVLLYDRNDTARRQWKNAADVHRKLHADDRADVRFVHQMPIALKDQVSLYAWADVLIAPHGAAMVNTIFLRPGAEVIEMWKRCDMNIAFDRFVPHDWTGWHTSLLDINLQYVQCHRLQGPYKSPKQLLNGNLGPPTDGPHKVRVEEMFELLEGALARQQVRLKILREEARSTNIDGNEVRNIFNSFAEKERFRTASKVSLFVLVPACATLLVLQSLSRRRKTTTRR